MERRSNIALRFALSVLIAGSLYFIIRSVSLALELERALAFADQWVFVVHDYFRYLDGQYHWTELFAHHNEHRIGTTRIVLFADAVLFNMQGWLPLLTQYLNLAGIAAMIARLATTKDDNFFVVLVPALALTWSISQFNNFSWAFQPSFSFVHLFAIAAIVSLSRALDAERWWPWLIAACGFDLLAANSLASGLLVIAPAICVSVWMRRVDRRLLIFCAAHLIISAWYFVGYVPHPYNAYGIPSLNRAWEMIANFIGMDFGGWYYLEISAGELSIIAFVLTAAAITWLSLVRKKGIDANSAALLSIAVFVFIEAVTVAFAREGYDLGPRYATMSVVFQCGLLGFYWRQSASLSSATIVRGAIIAVATIVLIEANTLRWESAWRDHIANIDKATDEFSKGIYSKATADYIFLGLSEVWVSRYRALHLAPF